MSNTDVELGRKEGAKETLVNMLLELVETKFGGHDQHQHQQIAAKIHEADTETLRLWTRRIFSVSSIESVFVVEDDS